MTEIVYSGRSISFYTFYYLFKHLSNHNVLQNAKNKLKMSTKTKSYIVFQQCAKYGNSKHYFECFLVQ